MNNQVSHEVMLPRLTPVQADERAVTLAEWTGMVETELFAKTYRSYGLATVRYPVLEVEAKVGTL